MHLLQGYYHYAKRKQPRPAYGLELPCLFPTKLTINPHAAPFENQKSINQYISLHFVAKFYLSDGCSVVILF